MESEVWSNNNDSFKQLPFNKWCQLPVVQEIPDAESLPSKEELISAKRTWIVSWIGEKW